MKRLRIWRRKQELNLQYRFNNTLQKKVK